MDGSDLSVHGRGAQGLTGSFSFQGEAEVPRLAGVRKEARGALSATWRAAETGRGRPWSVAFTGAGRDFASGLGQLDRLLGRAPQLKAEGQYANGVVRVDASTLTGQSGQAKAKGTVALNGVLGLKLDWSAQGPFQAGPATLTGNARGSGDLTGRIDQPRIELTSSFDQIDLPELTLQHALVDLAFVRDATGYDGSIALKAGSAWGPAQAQSRFAFTPSGVRLAQLSLDAGGLKAQGAVTLSRSGPSDADITFAAGPGAFLSAGSAAGTIRLTSAAAAQAEIEIAGSKLAVRNAPFTIESLRLSGHGALDHLPFSLSATTAGPIPASFEGSGVYGRNGAVQSVSLNGSGKLRGIAYRTRSPLVVGLSPDMRTMSADIGVGRGRLTASAREAQDGFTAKGNVTGLELAALDSRLTGELEGAVDVTGRGAQLSGTLTSRLSDVRDRDAPEAGALNADINGTLAGGRLQLTAAGRDAAGGTANAQVELPVLASAAPLHLAIARTEPMSGRFSIQGEVQPYWRLIAGGEDSLTGQLAAQGTIGGTLAAPSISGTANLQKATFEDARTGLELRDMAMALDFTHDAAVVQTFRADDGRGGTITGQGRVNLARGGDSSFTLDFHRFELLNRDEANARASGPVTVTRAADGRIKLAGDLRVDRAVISPNPPTPAGVVRLNVVEINKPAGRGEDYAPPNTGPPIQLDISLNAPGQVLVQGRGLNLNLSLKAHLGGSAHDPLLTGTATVVRGDYTFAGKRFDVSPGGVIDLSTRIEDIRLNLEAVYNPPTGGLTATVYVRGTAAHPDIKITSSPSLPQDEVLSQILFGASASQLSTAQAAQIGAATASLAAGGGLDVLSNLSRFAGLDVLSFGAVGNGLTRTSPTRTGLTVTGGKYVGSNLYLEVVGGGQGGTSVQADWRALKNFSIVSQIAGQGYSRISIYWRKDFH
jgi:translocation and assembly module TamB